MTVGKSGVGSGAPQPEEKSVRAKHLLLEVRNNNNILGGICKRGSRICQEGVSMVGRYDRRWGYGARELSRRPLPLRAQLLDKGAFSIRHSASVDGSHRGPPVKLITS